MKQTRSLRILNSGRTKPVPGSQNGRNDNSAKKGNPKTLLALNYVKTAAKKVAGVFTKFVLGQNKTTTSKGAKADVSTSNSQVQKQSFSIDVLTGSKNKSSSRFRYSDSYGSSSYANGQGGAASFSIQEIYKATNNFSQANRIGEGGFGTVYKGKLRNGSIVAIKRAKKNVFDKRLSMEFKNEVLALSKIEHLNLVRLHGYLEHGDERIIVVEYVDNGTLREHLDGVPGTGLEIAERLDIAIDVAHALTYLHTYSDPPIIHRDIKASNILITEKLRAKVADFGFARLAAEDSLATHISTQIKGTAGYLDPEYLRTYQLTEKSDVYSFGVLLVEMMTGRNPIEQKRALNERVTTRWAMRTLKEREVVVVMDPKLRRSPASNLAVERVLKLASQCLAPMKQSRPPMKKCAEVLWGIRKELKQMGVSASPSQRSAHLSEKDARKLADDDRYKFISA